jgi:hypothetical protein
VLRTAGRYAAAFLSCGLGVLLRCAGWAQATGKVLQRLLGEVTVRVVGKQRTVDLTLLQPFEDGAGLLFRSGQLMAVFSLGANMICAMENESDIGSYLVGSTDHSCNIGCVGLGCDLSCRPEG